MVLMPTRPGRGPSTPIVFVPVLGDLALSGALVSGVASTGTILNATTGSTITSSISGLTVNSAARTYSYSGAGSAGSVQGLVETLAGATFSPRNNSVVISAAAIPTFTSNPSINPTSGDANTRYTGTDGTLSNGATVVSRRFLLDGTAIGTGTTIIPGAAGALVFENTGPGGAIAMSTPVQVLAVAPVLDSLSVSPPNALNGAAYTGTVVGKTADSVLSLSSAGATGLSISGNRITGTPTANGPVNIIETLSTASNSPRTTSNALVVSATATLNALSVTPKIATIGTAFTGTITGKTADSTLSLTGAGAAGLSVSGTTITGTPTTAGAVNVVETLAGASNSPRTTSGVVAVSATQSAPLKTALLQNRVPTAADSGGGTRTNCGFRWPLILGCDNSSLVIDLCATWLTDYNGTGIATWELVGMSLEDATTGQIIPVTFSGSRTVTVPGGTIRLPSDEIPASAFGLTMFPQGRVLTVKGIARTSASGNQLPLSQRTTSDGGGAQVWWHDPAATTLSSIDATGPFTVASGASASAVRNGFCPIVRGRHVRPTTAFLGLGDSIMEITSDSANNFYGRAFFQRAMHDGSGTANTMRPSIIAAKIGIQTDGLTRSPFWKEYLDAIDVVISELLTNDLGLGQTDVPAMQKLLADLYAQITPYGKPIYQTNWTPRTTSTDDWTTVANQTPRAAWVTGGTRDQVIAWVDARVADGTLAGKIDTLTATCASGDNSRWAAPPRGTSDGTHPYGSVMEKMAVAVRATIAKYPINGL